MSERDSLLRQRAGDQQATVAIERLALGAHEAQAEAPHRFGEAIEAGAKRRRRSHPLVVGDAVAIERRIARPTAQNIAERQIGDVLALQARAQLLAGEPREASREWNRAHVRDRGY